jgi:ornithine cyclodeaminase/alanine dehydrogenase-like protein (mu-crystallin family)
MLILNDTETGMPLALMSANLLSAYRTGAVPGMGARFLARPDSRVVGIVGPGVMAHVAGRLRGHMPRDRHHQGQGARPSSR